MTYTGEELETCMILTTSSWWHQKLWKWFVQHTTCKDNSRCNSITAQPLVYARYTHKNDGKTEFPFCKPTETILTARQIKKKKSVKYVSNTQQW